MPESLLDECYQSILKIAETQSHDAKRTIVALAEMFQDNSGRRSYDSQPSQKQFMRPIVRGYLPTGSDRGGLLDKRPDPVADHSRSDATIMHCKDNFSDHMTLGEALMRL
jgi:hypothetical protein